MIERAGIDVPRIVILRQVFEGLQLVAAGPGRQRFKARLLVVEAGNATRLWIYSDFQRGILKCQSFRFQIAGKRLHSWNHMEHLIPKRRHFIGLDQHPETVGLWIAFESLRRHDAIGRIEHGNSARCGCRQLHIHSDRP